MTTEDHIALTNNVEALERRVEVIAGHAHVARADAAAVNLSLVSTFGEVKTSLAEIGGKVDTSLARMGEHFANLNGTIARHDKSIAVNDDRIRLLESAQADRLTVIAQFTRAHEEASARIDHIDRMKVSREALQPVADDVAGLRNEIRALVTDRDERRGADRRTLAIWGVALVIVGWLPSIIDLVRTQA